MLAADRRHLLAMDDEMALLARQVAMAASAWRHAKADTEAYRRLVLATGDWDEYCAPRLDKRDDVDKADVAAQLRRAARQALRALDDEAALLARHVAMTASAWLHAPTDTDAYRRFVVATDDWDAYLAPRFEVPVVELLDQLGDESAPRALDEVVADFSAQIRKADPGRGR